MPAIHIGLPTASGSEAKVLESSEYQREANGLETLRETYTVRSSNRISLAPLRDVLHSAYSTASVPHSRMAVEAVSFNDQPGNLTSIIVTYVGLTSSSGLPAPVVRLIPQPNRIFIEAEYVSDATESSLANIAPTTRMPAQINGVAMPSNPGPRILQRGGGINAGATLTDLGYCFDTTQCVRPGLFLVVRATFKKKIFGTGLFGPFSQM